MLGTRSLFAIPPSLLDNSRGPEQRVFCEPTPPYVQDTGAMTRSAGDNPMPVPLYQPTSGSALSVDTGFYGRLGHEVARRTLVKQLVVPIRTGKAWPVRAGHICRIVAIAGPQVGDLNLWHLHNPRERFWAARTKQLHHAHMRVFDRFWSCLPYLRPMATVIGDSINYGIDPDGARCHDLLGTRCDPYVHKLLTGAEWEVCCHSNLVRAVLPYRLHESDIHDVLNVFQVTGLTPRGISISSNRVPLRWATTSNSLPKLTCSAPSPPVPMGICPWRRGDHRPETPWQYAARSASKSTASSRSCSTAGTPHGWRRIRGPMGCSWRRPRNLRRPLLAMGVPRPSQSR